MNIEFARNLIKLSGCVQFLCGMNSMATSASVAAVEETLYYVHSAFAVELTNTGKLKRD